MNIASAYSNIISFIDSQLFTLPTKQSILNTASKVGIVVFSGAISCSPIGFASFLAGVAIGDANLTPAFNRLYRILPNFSFKCYGSKFNPFAYISFDNFCSSIKFSLQSITVGVIGAINYYPLKIVSTIFVGLWCGKTFDRLSPFSN